MRLIAPSSAGTDVTRMKTYIYSLNFQCLANSIEEADDCFLTETQLSVGKKHAPATSSPNISVQVIPPPMFPEMTELESRGTPESESK